MVDRDTLAAKRSRLHLFFGTSDLHLAAKHRMEKPEALATIERAIKMAKGRFTEIEFSAEDALRTDPAFLKEALECAAAAGADVLNVPDTVGYTSPEEIYALFADLTANVARPDHVVFSTHNHNDLGMAVANSLAAVRGGAGQVECTINGIGERAGNCALEEVVMALKVRGDIMPYYTDIDTAKIMNISRRVASVSGFAVQFNKAIVGKNAFAHESGIHQDGMLKNAETFEIMRPEDVGLAATNLVMGKHSGRAALRSKLEELGYKLGDNQLKDVFVRFKELADRKKEIYDDDLIALMRAGEDAENDRLVLKSLRVTCGTDGPQEAVMTLSIEGQEVSTTATGDGPVDATFNAVKALYAHTARLQLYQVHAVTEGTDAQATVSVRMEEDGNISTGESADTDTVVASARAYLNALNRLLVRRDRIGEDHKEINYKDYS